MVRTYHRCRHGTTSSCSKHELFRRSDNKRIHEIPNAPSSGIWPTKCGTAASVQHASDDAATDLCRNIPSDTSGTKNRWSFHERLTTHGHLPERAVVELCTASRTKHHTSDDAEEPASDQLSCVRKRSANKQSLDGDADTSNYTSRQGGRVHSDDGTVSNNTRRSTSSEPKWTKRITQQHHT